MLFRNYIHSMWKDADILSSSADAVTPKHEKVTETVVSVENQGPDNRTADKSLQLTEYTPSTSNAKVLVDHLSAISKNPENTDDKGITSLFEGIKTLLKWWSFAEAGEQFFEFIGNMRNKNTADWSEKPDEETASPNYNVYDPEAADITLIQNEITHRQDQLDASSYSMPQKRQILEQLSNRKQQLYAQKNLAPWAKVTPDTYGEQARSPEFQKQVLYNEIHTLGVGTVLNLCNQSNSETKQLLYSFTAMYESWAAIMPADHTAIISRIEGNEIYMIEADRTKGVHECKLSTFLNDNDFRSSTIVTMQMDVDQTQREAIVEEARSYVLQEYDYGWLKDDLLHPENHEAHDNNQKYCSEVILDAVRQVTGKSLDTIHTPNQLGGFLDFFKPTYKWELSV